MILPNRNTPRWLIFLIDLTICFFSLSLAYLLRFEFAPPKSEIALAITFLPIFLIVRSLTFVIWKTYAGIIRYTSTQDSQRILITLAAGSVLFYSLNFFKFHFLDGAYFVPNSVIVIDFLASLFIMISSRIAVKVLYLELKSPTRARSNIVIFGAGEAGVITQQTLERDRAAGLAVIAFIDDDKNKSGKKINGASIYHSSKAEEFFSQGKVDQLIISIQELSPERKAQMIDLALKYNVRVMNVPPVGKWINGELSVRQLREINIEDLLGRSAIKLNNPELKNEFKGARILVTGAAGSIGSELSRQLIALEPAELVLLDQAETPLYELEQEFSFFPNYQACQFAIADVRQKDRLRRAFEKFKPEYVFHAAAYKHVPLMEENPSEAILTNVLGTRNLADLSSEFKVKRFVFVSTDKAVNPTSVMGASKRLAEMYVQALNANSSCAFITTRFGNVLGSNGSVIPLFKRQIETGGPLTVTHAEMTRFFMTIPEASELVLEASIIGKGGEIFLFDMGESVKIIDLAKNMIKLYGLELDRDIEIKITGLRPGEKLYEELFTSGENHIPTDNKKILKLGMQPIEYTFIQNEISTLTDLFKEQDNVKIVAKMKSLVPEYRSNNSTFEQLDIRN